MDNYLSFLLLLLEVMALSMAVSPKVMDSLHTTSLWKPFLIDVILKSKNRFAYSSTIIITSLAIL